MDNRYLSVEQRAVFLGVRNDYIDALIENIGRELTINFVFVDTEEELIEKCYSYEPALILTDLTPKYLTIIIKAARIRKYRHSVSIGLLNASCDNGSRLIEEHILSEEVVKTGDPVSDSVNVIYAYKRNIRFGINIKTIVDGMPIVTDNIWHDYSWDARLLRSAISQRLDKLGVRKELTGHKYLIAAIVLQSTLVHVPEPIKLYEKIAKYYETNAASVEKAIRYAIEAAWTFGDIEYQHAVFGMSIDEERGKPTNAEFIARLAIDY